MHFMVLLSCHNIHVVVVVVTIHSNKQAHIIAHCETNYYEMKQNERKQNKGIKTVVFKSSTTPAGYKSFLLYTINIIFVNN